MTSYDLEVLSSRYSELFFLVLEGKKGSLNPLVVEEGKFSVKDLSPSNYLLSVHMCIYTLCKSRKLGYRSRSRCRPSHFLNQSGVTPSSGVTRLVPFTLLRVNILCDFLF